MSDVHSLLGTTFETKEGTAELDLKSNKVIGIYFSAHWCPPCRGFTPILGEKYKALKEAGKDFEIVFVSSDRDESAFKEYHSEMPFVALPYGKRDEKEKLSEHFGVRGIPTLVFIDGDTGEIITKNGRSPISAPTFIEDFPYYPKPVNDLNVDRDGLTDGNALILLMEGASPEERKELTSALVAVAEKELPKEGGVKKFFTGTEGGIVGQIRNSCGLPIIVLPHSHPLEKKEGGGWGCDGGCGRAGPGGNDRYRCTDGCDFDYCGDCKAKAESPPEDGLLKQELFIWDYGSRSFYIAEDAAEEGGYTEERITAFISDFRAGKLVQKDLTL
jgi:thiol-disulfide isomerase/thioredoxin